MADTNLVDWNGNSIDRTPVQYTLAEVRPAVPNDIADIVDMCREYAGPECDWTPLAVAATLEYWFVVGYPPYAVIQARPWNDLLLLMIILVRPSKQRGGAGRLMLEAMESVARYAGLKGVINIGPKTEAVNRLYAKMGYKEINRVKDAWGPGKDAVHLFKEVNNG